MPRQLPGKTLLFSRWRGAPTSIAAFLSVELAGGVRKPGVKPSPPLLRPGGSEAGALVATFMPWPHLARAIEPMKDAKATISRIKKDAGKQLRAFLERQHFKIEGEGKRPIWLVACGIEHRLSQQRYRRIARFAAGAQRNAKARDWSRIEPIASISEPELHALALHLLSAPGSIVARCAHRHDIPTDEKLFALSWRRLRSYLGHRAFADLILRAGKRSPYPAALCEAMLKGGFEAVLDEQICLIEQAGDAKGAAIVDQLSACLLDRPGLVQFRRGKNLRLRIPVQAITPFAGGEQRRTGAKKAGRLRGDTLRRAFNSPFWPHVLCTTSVGQEGLDFHLWCSRIVHWDLPGDPVDFEQREGRIARFGSLAVRRSLAEKHAEEALAGTGNGSPFTRLLEIARMQPQGPTGLEQWWLPTSDHRPVSVSYDWPFSLRSERKRQMLQDLLFYRLALGQPDPEAFVEMLRRVGADERDARSLAVDLAPISRPERKGKLAKEGTRRRASTR